LPETCGSFFDPGKKPRVPAKIRRGPVLQIQAHAVAHALCATSQFADFFLSCLAPFFNKFQGY